MITRYFTFGPSQSLPDGSPAGGTYVAVTAPPGIDHRALLMAYLGSNEFSSEYDEGEWGHYRRTYPVTALPAVAIRVEAPVR